MNLRGPRLPRAPRHHGRTNLPLQNAAALTGRGWFAGDGLPPGFYFSTAQRPHLHATYVIPVGGHANGPWNLAYLAYTNAQGAATVIYQPPLVDNQAAIANLPAFGNHTAVAVQAEATYAYNNR